jgi:hypothetical protein
MARTSPSTGRQQTSISISKSNWQQGGLAIRIVKAALLYFAIVFGVGFVLGTNRTLFLVPRLGARQPNCSKCQGETGRRGDAQQDQGRGNEIAGEIKRREIGHLELYAPG